MISKNKKKKAPNPDCTRTQTGGLMFKISKDGCREQLKQTALPRQRDQACRVSPFCFSSPCLLPYPGETRP